MIGFEEMTAIAARYYASVLKSICRKLERIECSRIRRLIYDTPEVVILEARSEQ